MRARLRTIVVVILALVLLGLFLRQADLRQVWIEIKRCRVDLVFFGFCSMAFNLAVRSYRWQYLLEPIGQTSFRNSFKYTTIGFAATFLLPARAGEFLRPYLIARREHFSATAAFATIVLERLIDLVTVLLLFGVFVVVLNPAAASVDRRAFEAIKIGGGVVAAAAVVGIAFMFVAAGYPAAIGRMILRFEAILPSRMAHAAARLAHMFAEGLAVIRQPRRLAVALALSFPLWLSVATGIWAVARAFQIQVPYTGSFLLMAILTVGVAVPTPGAVGGFHEAFRLGVTTFYGAANDRAVGAGLILHALSFVPVTILGIVFAAQDGLSLGRIRSLAGLSAPKEADEVPVLRPSGR